MVYNVYGIEFLAYTCALQVRDIKTCWAPFAGIGSSFYILRGPGYLLISRLSSGYVFTALVSGLLFFNHHEAQNTCRFSDRLLNSLDNHIESDSLDDSVYAMLL